MHGVVGCWSVLLVLLVMAAPAAAVCEYHPPPTKAERFQARVRNGQEFRREFGMPSSRRHVIRVLRSRRVSRWWGLPLTYTESRYLNRRTSAGPGWDLLERYTRRHGSTFGGLSIGNDYPRGAAAVLRWTRGARHHAAVLRPLVPFPVRVRTVDYSERRLRRAQHRVDFDALEDEGVEIVGAGVDVDRNRVALDIISPRPDAVRLTERRFGPLFLANLIARRASFPVCVGADAATVDAEGRHLTLYYETNSSYAFDRVIVREEADRVAVGIVEQAPTGPTTLVAETRTAEAVLTQPLGDRRLVFLATNRPILIRQPGVRPANARSFGSLRLRPVTGSSGRGRFTLYAAENPREGFYDLKARGLPSAPAGGSYGIWLTGGAHPHLIGQAPETAKRFAVSGPPPPDTAQFLDWFRYARRIIVTAEPPGVPTSPGRILLRGNWR